MRRYEEPIAVRVVDPPGGTGASGRAGIPARFVWRGAAWSVRAVARQWVETGAWWKSSLVRAARSGDVVDPGADPGRADLAGRVGTGRVPADELLGQNVIFLVEAVSARTGAVGVFELVYECSQRWVVRGVAD